MNHNHSIYVLNDGHGRIFYCGRTGRRDLEVRLREHLDEAMTGSSAKCRHIRELLDQGHTITIKKVDEAPADQIAEAEAYWIDRLDCSDMFGYVVFLRNGNAGSQGNPIDEVQTRADIQQWKKAVRKPKKALQPTGGACDPKEYEHVARLYETDRAAYEREYAIHKERQADAERGRKQLAEMFADAV